MPNGCRREISQGWTEPESPLEGYGGHHVNQRRQNGWEEEQI